MALPYKIWTEEEIEQRNVIEAGQYAFEIQGAYMKKTSGGLDKNGQPKPIRDMMELNLAIVDKTSAVRYVKDWIVFMDFMDWKLRHLAQGLGLLKLYEMHELDLAHLIRKSGQLILGIKELKSDDGVIKKVNYVKDYVIKAQALKSEVSFADDDIPM